MDTPNNHPLLQKANDILDTVKALEPEMEDRKYGNEFYGAIETAAKWIVTYTTTFVNREDGLVALQGAANIRQHANILLMLSNDMKDISLISKEYSALLHKEILEYRALFVERVYHIKNDLFNRETDEWGLF